MDDRRVWVADPFDGTTAPAGEGDLSFPPDLNTVREGFARFRLLDQRVVFLPGDPASVLSTAPISEIALLRIDGLEPAEVEAVLETAYDRVAPGGFIVIDDYNAPACQAAVDRFRTRREVVEPLARIDWSAAFWRRDGGRSSGSTEAPPEVGAPPVTKELSVVVVVHDMLREARRTLHSLSRSYQVGIEELDYEVIVVENGSAPEQRLGEEFVASFGPEFRYVDLGEESSPSPARAANRGIAASSGGAVAVMIDGAHVLTPGSPPLRDAGTRDLRARGRDGEAVVRRPRAAARDGGGGVRTRAGGPPSRADRLARRRLPAVRDRPLHRTARLVRRRYGRATASSFPGASSSRSAGSTRASPCRAGGYANLEFYERARELSRRDAGDHPGRGLVPPAPRRARRRISTSRRGARR